MSFQVAERVGRNDCMVSVADQRRITVTYVLGSLRDAGTERQAFELIRNLDRKTFFVSVILLENVGADRLVGFVEKAEVIDISQAGLSNWLFRAPSLISTVVRIRKCLTRWRTDVMHAFLPAPSILGGLAGRMAQVPVIVGSRRSLPSFYRANRGLLSTKADILGFRLADVTLGNSIAVTKEMKSFGCPSRKCYTILNGVDTARFRPSLSRTLRQEMGWKEDDIVVGMLANFRPCKRHCDFLAAAVILLRRYPGLRFVMMGADGGGRSQIEMSVRDMGVENNVWIVNSRPDPEAFLAAIDIYVCTSDSEGLSNSVLEALACAKPVIATRVGGNPEVIADGESGLLIPARSPESLVGAIEFLISQRDARLSMGMCARALIEARFSLQRMVSEHEKLYVTLMSERGHR